jgi:hypothetical protein
METTIISWTPTNWITIFLMAVGGFVILKLGVMLIQNAQGAPSVGGS